MIALRWIAAGLVLASLAAGTIGDSQPEHPRLRLGGYHAMAADFHIHSFRLSWAMLATWDTVMEAQRQGPDAIAIVGHNHVWVSKSGPLFLALRRRSAGPHRRGDRVGALPPAGHRDRLDYGLETAGGERPSAPLVLARIRREGQAALDGAEVLHPIAYESERKPDKESWTPSVAALLSVLSRVAGILGLPAAAIAGLAVRGGSLAG